MAATETRSNRDSFEEVTRCKREDAGRIGAEEAAGKLLDGELLEGELLEMGLLITASAPWSAGRLL